MVFLLSHQPFDIRVFLAAIYWQSLSSRVYLSTLFLSITKQVLRCTFFGCCVAPELAVNASTDAICLYVIFACWHQTSRIATDRLTFVGGRIRIASLCAYAHYGLMAAPHLDDSVCKETIQHLLFSVSRFCVSRQLIALKLVLKLSGKLPNGIFESPQHAHTILGSPPSSCPRYTANQTIFFALTRNPFCLYA